MQMLTAGTDALGVRQVFETWWIGVPIDFEETFVDEDGGGYWHAWDDHRSVSLTSTVLHDVDGRPVPAELIAATFPGMLPGETVDHGPRDLLGLATTGPALPDSRASRVVTGVIAVEGRVLLATITSDDVDWALGVWRSILYGPGVGGSQPGSARPAAPRWALVEPPRSRRRPGWDRALH